MKGELKGSWLDDDPEWKALRDRINTGKPSKPVKNEAAPSEAVSGSQKPNNEAKNIKVSFDVSLPKLRLPKLPSLTAKQMHMCILAAVVLIAAFGIFKLTMLGNKPSNSGPGVLGGNVQEPEFDAILPDGKKEETESGKIGYDPAKRVASFTDTIGNVPITISQQPLPANFKDNPDEELKKLAENFSANEVIMESNPKAYLGTSVKGPQTVVFHKKGVLVFIQSASQVEKTDWAAYITKLL